MKRLSKNILPVLFLVVVLITLSACNKDKNKEILTSQKENIVLEKGNSATLEDAIKNDDKKAIVYLLKHDKADPNQKTENGEPLLNIAARRGFAFAVEQLLKAGANVNATSNWGNTALMNLYQEDYADVSAEGNYDIVLDLLLAAEPNVNIHNKDKDRTALMLASYIGDVNDVEKLIAVGADVNAQDENGDNALVWACVGLDSTSEYDEQNKLEVVKLLLDAGAKQKNEALIAAADNFPLIVKILLDAGADVNAANREGYTPLQVASSPLGNSEVVKLLKAAGAKE